VRAKSEVFGQTALGVIEVVFGLHGRFFDAVAT